MIVNDVTFLILEGFLKIFNTGGCVYWVWDLEEDFKLSEVISLIECVLYFKNERLVLIGFFGFKNNYLFWFIKGFYIEILLFDLFIDTYVYAINLFDKKFLNDFDLLFTLLLDFNNKSIFL